MKTTPPTDEADAPETNNPSAERSRPVVFISYSWTTPAHEDWVLDLAGGLQAAYGLDVRLDKWHLPTGGDTYRFMEREIKGADKVLIVSDCEYARKADAREGGAGTGTQILTPELYAQGGGHAAAGGPLPKFAVVVTEYRDDPETGKRVACTPTFYGGRIFVDMTDPSRRPEKVEEVARWAYDEPLHRPPPFGGRPDFLDEGPSTGTSGVRTRALAALASARPDATRAVEDYFDRLAEGLAAFSPVVPSGNTDYGVAADAQLEALIASAQALGTAYAEAEGAFVELARARLGDRGHDAYRRLFTALFPYVERGGTLPDGGQLTRWHRGVYAYIVPDLLRAAVAALIRVGDFDGVAALTAIPYTPPDADQWSGGLAVREFTGLQPGVENTNLRDRLFQLRRDRPGSLAADEGAQADLLLYLASEATGAADGFPTVWWPALLAGDTPWARRRTVLPTFAQAESRRHLRGLATAVSLDPDGLLALLRDLAEKVAEAKRSGRPPGVPAIDYDSLTGLSRLGTRP